MNTNKLQQELTMYNAKVEKSIAKFPERPHLNEKRLYTPLDLPEDFDYSEKLGFPGQYPFTRGVQPTMYRRELILIRRNPSVPAREVMFFPHFS